MSKGDSSHRLLEVGRRLVPATHFREMSGNRVDVDGCERLDLVPDPGLGQRGNWRDLELRRPGAIVNPPAQVVSTLEAMLLLADGIATMLKTKPMMRGIQRDI